MRIHVLSDLHLEFGSYTPSAFEADCVVLAGDIHVNENSAEWILANYAKTPVFYVLGNHEFYGERLPRLTEKLRARFKGTNVQLLENDAFEFGGYHFFGSTLWTDMALLGDAVAGSAAALEMTDFKRIRLSPSLKKFRPIDARRFHAEARLRIEQFLQTHGGKSIIITHHAPSIRSLPAYRRKDPVSCGYASNLESVIQAHQPALWIHGHIHSVTNYKIGRTIVRSNPRGYPDEINQDFVADLVIELPKS